MAIQINATLHHSGVTITTGSLLTCDFANRRTIPVTGADPIRNVEYGLYLSKNQAEYLANPSSIIGSVDEFPSNYVKSITPDEYTALLANGALAEVWLKDWLETFVGVGNCTIIDPFV